MQQNAKTGTDVKNLIFRLYKAETVYLTDDSETYTYYEM
jgi:hypothetical protein